MAGECRGEKVVQRVLLPTSFIGGPRDMRRHYMNAMTLVQYFGRPDIFITMTCNTEWVEIQEELCEGQLPQDRPDLVTRVFRAKLQDLKDQIFNKEIFGPIAAHVFVIEFQKRGLPHIHLLVILKEGHKITTPDQYDRFIYAELPDKDKQPHLNELVIRPMMHGPCGENRRTSPCMKDDQCKFHYPRPFSNKSIQGKDGYPIYRRRNDGKTVNVRGMNMNNQWVVPYNPYLLMRHNCHINVEVCSGVKGIKYLYKYIYKGHDGCAVYIESDDGEKIVDEIRNFQDARWVSLPEALWRIYEFNLSEMQPPVINLQLHLPVNQAMYYWKKQNLRNVMASDTVKHTMLTEYFRMCSIDDDARNYLYREFLEHYVWNPQPKIWTKRKTRSVIGRIAIANPREGERYYERLLLNHVRGPFSFEDLLTVNGKKCETFKEAAKQGGLLESDNSISECLREAVFFKMPSALRSLFATILVRCNPTDIRNLWETYYDDMSEDFRRMHRNSPATQLQSNVRSRGMIALATATSGVAVAILPGGRTTHSRYGIPLQTNDTTITKMSKQSAATKLIGQAKLIIWDKAPMTKRQTIETVDRSFRDIMDVNVPFGGKVMVFGGDFRQVLQLFQNLQEQRWLTQV
uniref:ATP-dependent DNA helicase n=1 Tax=Nicotiana sylvestris TaxID=4096 RepID=A0A1U7VMH0_NICSY|nr:PREDICTED: uncharacterized protein LOC104215018 [Nicotiana sylvestris]